MLGYRLKNGKYVVVPEEAEIICHIFSEYLGGYGCGKIAKGLNKDNVPSRFNKQWHTNSIAKIIRNYSYTENLLLQKTYRENHITKKTCINSGKFPKYLAENTHDAIIDIETFEKVQSEIKRRAQKYNRSYDGNKTYPFTGLLKCDNCGKHYRRKITKTQAVWMCAGYLTLGKEYCTSKQIPETVLENQVQAVTSDITTIKEIIVADKNTLRFVMKDGQTISHKGKIIQGLNPGHLRCVKRQDKVLLEGEKAMAKSVKYIPATKNIFTAMPTMSISKRRVAAYARVSTDSDEQFTSYEAQIDYYTRYITKRDDWEFVKVYTDEGITGTSTKHRDGFNLMVKDALDGKIDLIITKSVSRFARNTVDSLTTVRKLQDAVLRFTLRKKTFIHLTARAIFS